MLARIIFILVVVAIPAHSDPVSECNCLVEDDCYLSRSPELCSPVCTSSSTDICCETSYSVCSNSTTDGYAAVGGLAFAAPKQVIALCSYTNTHNIKNVYGIYSVSVKDGITVQLVRVVYPYKKSSCGLVRDVLDGDIDTYSVSSVCIPTTYRNVIEGIIEGDVKSSASLAEISAGVATKYMWYFCNGSTIITPYTYRPKTADDVVIQQAGYILDGSSSDAEPIKVSWNLTPNTVANDFANAGVLLSNSDTLANTPETALAPEVTPATFQPTSSVPTAAPTSPAPTAAPTSSALAAAPQFARRLCPSLVTVIIVAFAMECAEY